MASRDERPQPGEDKEHYQIRLLHEAFLKTIDGRFLNAPLADPVGRVLEIGAGSGIWAAAFARAHPTAEVVGIDLFPPYMAAPANCRYVIQDAERDWDAIGGARFDIVHARLIPWHAVEFPAVLRRCYEHLRPGGCIEMQELLLPLRSDEAPGVEERAPNVLKWSRLRLEAAAKLGIDQTHPERLPEAFAEAGFVETQVQDYKWPVGSWTEDEKLNDVGTMFMDVMQSGKLGFSLQLLAHLGMAEGEIIDLVEQAGRELGVGKVYVMVRFVWAKKPE